MSLRSLTYEQGVFKRYHSDKHISAFSKIFIFSPEWIYPVAKQAENDKLINLTINW